MEVPELGRPMLDRLYANWVYGGFLAGLILLALTPLLVKTWSLPELLVFVILPVYMLHQYEEHDADRFRTYLNTTVAAGRAGLSSRAVFFANVIGVWGVLTVVMWLVFRADPGWGIIAAYLLLINAAAHCGTAIKAGREYNPGLFTAIVFLLPLGAASYWVLLAHATAVHHAVALALVVGLHAWVIVHARRAA